MKPEELAQVVHRALIGPPPPPEPDVVDIIDLYLFLPTIVEDVSGHRFQSLSALTSLLAAAHHATGRNDANVVVDENLLGNLLGALGYLSLIDQAGKVVRFRDRDDPAAPTPFENVLIQGGETARDAATWYALRNALTHSFGLSNRNLKRPELQHTFTLEPFRFGAENIEYPHTPWTGEANDVEGCVTTMSLQALGDMADVLLIDLCEEWMRDRALLLAPGQTTAQIRRDYIYRLFPDSDGNFHSAA